MSGRLVADAGRLGSDTTIVTCDDQQTAAAASALILDLYQSQLDQSGGRCVPQVTTTTSKGGILAFHAPGSPGIPVPATGPDSVPEWVYADSNLILPTAETYPAAVASRVLVVAFEPSADSLARAAFVNAHGLEVVGGYAGPEGAEILGVIT